jgi:phytanoyl-CoA hydroxylase
MRRIRLSGFMFGFTHSGPVRSFLRNRRLAQFNRDGYTIFRSAITTDLIAETRSHVDWVVAKYPEVRPEKLLDPKMIVDDPFWIRLVSDDALLDIAEQFVGPDIALFASGYLSKPPHDGQAVLWHQDASYWPLEPMEVVTLWLAVDAATPDNGCMRVIPGTHRNKLEALLPRNEVPNVLESGIDPELVDESDAIDVVLRPGDVSVHHPNIIHGSKSNNSDKRRCGLIIRYIPTTTRILVPEGESYPTAFLLRGKPVPGVNIYNERPKFDPARHMAFRGAVPGR